MREAYERAISKRKKRGGTSERNDAATRNETKRIEMMGTEQESLRERARDCLRRRGFKEERWGC